MTKQIANKKLKNSGFSLIELSVVLIIIGIIIYMTLGVTTAQLEMGRIKTTQDKLAKIQTALIVYYQINGRLPCPANGSLANSSANPNFGLGLPATGTADCTSQNFTSSAPIVYTGVVPTHSLGLSDDWMIDSWGNRITYAVTRNCVYTANWATTNTYKCSDGVTSTVDGDGITMIGKNGSATAWPKVAYVAISHGKNSYGAWPRAGGSRITTYKDITPFLGEAINAQFASVGGSGLSSNIYYDLPINDGNVNGSYFDDLTIWNTAAQIDYNANH